MRVVATRAIRLELKGLGSEPPRVQVRRPAKRDLHLVLYSKPTSSML